MPKEWRWASSQRVVEDLEQLLRKRLPEYMVPFNTLLIDRMPLSPNGKVNRRLLPEPGRTGRAQAAIVQPRTAVEETLCAIWGEVLGLEEVSIASNFFELGGHSLLATQVVSRVRTMFRMDLSVRRIFEAPTVDQLASVIEQELRLQRSPKGPGAVRVASSGESSTPQTDSGAGTP